jgi:hypothetical protein
MPVDRDKIQQQLKQGLGPDQIARGDRETHHAVLEEQARLSGELGAFEPTPENIVQLRDERNLRWEAIAVRTYGSVRNVPILKSLYDELKGEGAARRSYTGRGRRFAGMQERPAPPVPIEPLAGGTHSALFGVEGERAATPDRLGEVDLLRTGSPDDVRTYLEHRLHSDRFYLDRNRIWLELPNHTDVPADKTLLTWFSLPSAYTVAGPSAGTRMGLHAIPTGWTATLCRLPVDSWGSGIRHHPTAEVGCRWCWIRLLACEIATGAPVTRA